MASSVCSALPRDSAKTPKKHPSSRRDLPRSHHFLLDVRDKKQFGPGIFLWPPLVFKFNPVELCQWQCHDQAAPKVLSRSAPDSTADENGIVRFVNRRIEGRVRDSCMFAFQAPIE